jgi:hypothetical protein
LRSSFLNHAEEYHVGLVVARRFPDYNILGDNCQTVVDHLLKRVVETEARISIKKRPVPLKSQYMKTLEVMPRTVGTVGQQVINMLGGNLGKYVHSASLN